MPCADRASSERWRQCVIRASAVISKSKRCGLSNKHITTWNKTNTHQQGVLKNINPLASLTHEKRVIPSDGFVTLTRLLPIHNVADRIRNRCPSKRHNHSRCVRQIKRYGSGGKWFAARVTRVICAENSWHLPASDALGEIRRAVGNVQGKFHDGDVGGIKHLCTQNIRAARERRIIIRYFILYLNNKMMENAVMWRRERTKRK